MTFTICCSLVLSFPQLPSLICFLTGLPVGFQSPALSTDVNSFPASGSLTPGEDGFNSSLWQHGELFGIGTGTYRLRDTSGPGWHPSTQEEVGHTHSTLGEGVGPALPTDTWTTALVIEPEEHLGAVPPQLHRKEWMQRPTHTLFENRSSVFLLLHNRKIITYSDDQPSPITRSKKQPIQLVFLFPAEAPRHRSFRGRGSQRPMAVSVLIVHLGPAGGQMSVRVIMPGHSGASFSPSSGQSHLPFWISFLFLCVSRGSLAKQLEYCSSVQYLVQAHSPLSKAHMARWFGIHRFPHFRGDMVYSWYTCV